MNPYFVTATDANGKRASFARNAASVEHLRGALVRDGYTDIALEDDDLSVRLRRQRPDFLPPVTEADLRFEAQLKRGPVRAAEFVRWLRGNAWLLGPGVLFFGAGTATGRTWLAVLGAAMLLFPVYHYVRWGRRTARYTDHLRAYALGDWARTQALIDQLRADPALTVLEQMQADLRYRDACLRARRGQLAEALADVASLRDTVHGEGGLFESRVASMHDHAGDIAGYLRGMHDAWIASGKGQVFQLDLAFAHARLGDAAEARTLLAGVDRDTLSTHHQPIATAVDGVLALRDGDPGAGANLLADAARDLRQFDNPVFWAYRGIIAGHLALALADTGHASEARAVLAPWRDVTQSWIDAVTWRRIETELGN